MTLPIALLSERPLATFRGVGLEDLGRWAKLLLRQLPDQMSFGLVGTLGAGKTRLVQSIATAAGIDPAEVTSPTYTLLQSHVGQRPHRGPVTLHHLDVYRIADEDEFLELGVEELFEEPSAWTLVEWADRVAEAMPAETLWVKLEIEPTGLSRQIDLWTQDAPRLAGAVQGIVQTYEQDS